MRLVIRTLVLLTACCLLGPSLALAEDAVVDPGAARGAKAISRDAAQKVKPEVDKRALKISPEKTQVSPAAKKALEAKTPELKKPAVQRPDVQKPQ